MVCTHHVSVLDRLQLIDNSQTDRQCIQLDTNKSVCDLLLHIVHFDHTFPDMDRRICCASMLDLDYIQHSLCIPDDSLRTDCLDIRICIDIRRSDNRHLIRMAMDYISLLALIVQLSLAVECIARMDHRWNHPCMYKLARDSKHGNLRSANAKKNSFIAKMLRIHENNIINIMKSLKMNTNTEFTFKFHQLTVDIDSDYVCNRNAFINLRFKINLLASKPHEPGHGSRHFCWMQASWLGQSELRTHSGRQFGGVPIKFSKHEHAGLPEINWHLEFGPQGDGTHDGGRSVGSISWTIAKKKTHEKDLFIIVSNSFLHWHDRKKVIKFSGKIY